MELKNLYTVKKILETGSFQNAAKSLNYAQSTITFQIRQLENELGIKIFEKNGTKMELTEEGRTILPLIDKVIEAADALLYYKSTTDSLGGTLKVALPETLVTYQLQPVLKAFKEQAPNVRLAIQVLNCYAIYEQMTSGEVDIAIHYDIGKYPANIITKTIGTFPLTLVGSPILQGKDRDFITEKQTKSICHIRNDPNALYLKMFHQYLKKKNIVLGTELELWSIESIKQSVRSNLGVAYLPEFTVEAELKQGLLQELPLDMPNSYFTAIYAYHKNKWKSPAVQLFLDILDQFYGNQQ